jgi:hypothetical protein
VSTLRQRCTIACIRTIEEKTLKSLFDLQLRIEDDQAKADGEGVVRCATPEESANRIESGVVRFLRLVRRELGRCSLLWYELTVRA